MLVCVSLRGYRYDDVEFRLLSIYKTIYIVAATQNHVVLPIRNRDLRPLLSIRRHPNLLNQLYTVAYDT